MEFPWRPSPLGDPILSFGGFKVTPHHRTTCTGSSQDQNVLVSKEEYVTNSVSSSSLDSKQPCLPLLSCSLSVRLSLRGDICTSGPSDAR